MLGIKKIIVAETDRVLQFNHGQLNRILTPGVHKVWTMGKNVNFVCFSICSGKCEIGNLEILLSVHGNLLLTHVDVVKTNDNQIALTYLDNKLTDIIEPASTQAFWKDRGEWRFEIIEMNQDLRAPDELVKLLSLNRSALIKRKADDFIRYVEVAKNATVLITECGDLVETLGAGRYGFWKMGRNIEVKLVDGRQQNLDVAGQEILSKDRVSLRLNLSAQYRVTDAVKAVTEHADYKDFVYRSLQLELREVVGTRTLDELLADKDALNSIIFERAKQRLSDCGVSLVQVGVKDIILPGEMKNILNQVVEAQKMAEANIIKRREETAATRSLHNTAKVMEGNATLLRLKELEVLERVSDRVDNITVYGGLDGLMNDMVTIPKKLGA